MRMIVKARHMTMTPSMRAHAEEKLGTALMRVFDRPTALVEIELSDLGHAHDGVSKECRVTLAMPRGRTLVICEFSDDIYKAINLAHDRILMQVKRARDRQLRPTRVRKLAARARALTARANLTAPREPWEREVAEFEASPASM